MYGEIKIPTGERPSYQFDGEDNTIVAGLKRVNIFVGANNSGKSKFMRSLVSNDLIYVDLQDSSNIQTMISSLNSIVDFKNPTSYTNYDEPKNYYQPIYQELSNKRLNRGGRSGINAKLVTKKTVPYKNDHISVDIDNNVNKLPQLSFIDKEYIKVYIPMLRGLKNPQIGQHENDIYEARVVRDNFGNNKVGFEIFTGLTLYTEFTNLLLGKRQDKDKVRAFEKFLGDNFFDGQQIDITPNIHDGNDVLHINIGNSEDIPVYELGDGISSIIILTFALFKYRDKDVLFFIEEPELSLHPGMERLFLETIVKQEYKKDFLGVEHQIYFTTHSNHLLDTGLDKGLEDSISIYQFSSTGDTNIKEIKNITQNKEILDILGVRNSSVFLSNCVIWVEGITDRMYIKKFFEIYQQEKERQFVEDRHYSFAEYGGANIAHFDFSEDEGDDYDQKVRSISLRNFLIRDHDGNKNFDGTYSNGLVGMDLKKTATIMGVNYFDDHITIENLISYEMYKSFFENGNQKCWKVRDTLGTKESFESVVLNEKIGTIIKDTFIELADESRSPEYWSDTSIKVVGYSTKTDFAKDILSHIEEKGIVDLSQQAKDLCENLYCFIVSHNS